MSTRTLWSLVSFSGKKQFDEIDKSIFSCEILSPCASNPCVRGTCRNRNSTSYLCACDPGFTGKHF